MSEWMNVTVDKRGRKTTPVPAESGLAEGY